MLFLFRFFQSWPVSRIWLNVFVVWCAKVVSIGGMQIRDCALSTIRVLVSRSLYRRRNFLLTLGKLRDVPDTFFPSITLVWVIPLQRIWHPAVLSWCLRSVLPVLSLFVCIRYGTPLSVFRESLLSIGRWSSLLRAVYSRPSRRFFLFPKIRNYHSIHD